MLLRFFLWLNSKFPEIPHPFNTPNAGEALYSGPLRYAEFEFEHAPKTAVLYDQAFRYSNQHDSKKIGSSFYEWIRGKTIADFCCGGGGKSLYFLTLGASKVIGLDTNPIFIEQAKKLAIAKGFAQKHGKANTDTAEFLLENVCATSFPDASVDAVIFNDAIDHISDPEKALREAMRVLKPEGLILVNFESYYFPWGHHLLDAIRIPWIHLFTTENFRIKLYKEIVKKFPDGDERLKFRIGHDEKGRERITYLNHLTIRKFEKILNNFTAGQAGARPHRSLRTQAHGAETAVNEQARLAVIAFNKVPLRRKWIQRLGSIPFFKEFFLSTHCWVLEKKANQES